MAENLSLAEREFHAVAGLFPLMGGRALEELAADIKKNGLREPILVDAQGRILDGRNRYRACLQAGVEPRFVEWQGEGSIEELALSLNLRRRHLNESQRALVAARLAKMMETDAIKRRGTPRKLDANLHPTQRRRSATEAAKMVNISTRLVNHAIKALQNGCDDLIAAVDAGWLAVSTASVLAGRTPEDQKAALIAGPRFAAFMARRARAEKRPAASSPAGQFRVMQAAESNDWLFLCIQANCLNAAIRALEARGFQRITG